MDENGALEVYEQSFKMYLSQKLEDATANFRSLKEYFPEESKKIPKEGLNTEALTSIVVSKLVEA